MPEISESQLKRFFHGECTTQEAEAVIDWLLNPSNQHLVKAMMQKQWETLQLADANVDNVDIEALLSKTKRVLNAPPSKPIAKPKWFTTSVFRIAASVAFFIISAAALIAVFKNQMPLRMTMNGMHEEVRTSTGQIILKVLPDGTKVWLNAQSTLVYPSSFGETREVSLKGEAYFDVVEDRVHPFIVHTDDIDIRVLGTAFNIKSYPGDPEIATTLIRGKVVIDDLSDSTTPIELKPNQQALFSHASKDIKLIKVDAGRFSSWTDGSLVFEDTQVYDVFKTLERWYGVTINVQEESNLACRLTARIDKESIAETLEMLKTITGIRYTIEGDEVTIEGSVCVP